MLILLLLLQLKHFLCDFVYQPPWMYLNKGRINHPGGWIHAGLHGVFTAAVFATAISPGQAVIFGLIDTVVHYAVDYTKVNMTARRSLTPKDEGFWVLLGADQALHQLTYISLVAFAV